MTNSFKGGGRVDPAGNDSKVFLVGDFNNFGAGGRKGDSAFLEKGETPLKLSESVDGIQTSVEVGEKGLSFKDQFSLG